MVAASVCVAPSTGALLATRGACPKFYREYGGVGVNLYDALWCGVDGNRTQTPCSHADVRTAMEVLATTGLRFFRFFASLWGAKQDVWLRQPGRYWAAFDRLMNDADSLQLYVVPSIGAEGWHLVHNQMVNSSFAAGSLEDLNDLVGNQTSIARALARRYYRELVTRYATRPNLLFCVPADLKPLTLGDSYQPAFIARRSLYRPSSCPISLRRGARE